LLKSLTQTKTSRTFLIRKICRETTTMKMNNLSKRLNRMTNKPQSRQRKRNLKMKSQRKLKSMKTRLRMILFKMRQTRIRMTMRSQLTSSEDRTLHLQIYLLRISSLQLTQIYKLYKKMTRR